MAQFTGSMTWIFTHLWWKLKRTNLLQIITFLGTVIQTPLGTFIFGRHHQVPETGARELTCLSNANLTMCSCL